MQHMMKTRNAFQILVGISVGPPGMSIWLKDNVKIEVGETGYKGMNWNENAQHMVGFCEETDESLGLITKENFLVNYSRKTEMCR
jgi:hypothetical protein